LSILIAASFTGSGIITKIYNEIFNTKSSQITFEKNKYSSSNTKKLTVKRTELLGILTFKNSFDCFINIARGNRFSSFSF